MSISDWPGGGLCIYGPPTTDDPVRARVCLGDIRTDRHAWNVARAHSVRLSQVWYDEVHYFQTGRIETENDAEEEKDKETEIGLRSETKIYNAAYRMCTLASLDSR